MTTRKKKLILHIGSYKTGSTSIQKTLHRNKQLLYENNINYLGSTSCDYSQFGQQVFHRTKKKDELIRIFKDSDCDTHILSDECLWNSRIKNKTSILDAISQSYEEVTIVSYIRNQCDFIESFLKQEHKNGMKYVQGMSVHEFYTHLKKTGALNYHNVIKSVHDILDKDTSVTVSVTRFEKDSLTNGDVVDDFLIKHIKIKDGKIKKHNTNSSQNLNEFLLSYYYHRINKLLQNNNSDNEFNKHFLLKLTQIYSNTISGKGILSEEFKESIYNEFNEENKKMFLTWGDGITFSNTPKRSIEKNNKELCLFDAEKIIDSLGK